MPSPVSVTSICTRSPSTRWRTDTPPSGRLYLTALLQQVEQHLAQALAVGVQPGGRGALMRQLDALDQRRRAHHVQAVDDQCPQLDAPMSRCRRPASDATEVEAYR